MSTSNTSSTGDAIVKFFEQTCSSREACHAQAKEIVGGEFEPVEIQGSRSYTGYAGEQRRDTIVQFRLEHSNYDIETARLARRIYERLVPGWYSYGVVDSSMNMKKHDEGKELLNTYVMNRLEGIPYLKSVLVQFPENSEECFTWRKNIMTGLGEFMARSYTWTKSPPDLPAGYTLPDLSKRCENLVMMYTKNLEKIQSALPDRFRPIIKECLNDIGLIQRLPMVLLPRRFSLSNILIEENHCHLNGVFGWGDADFGPFGLRLHQLEVFTGRLHPEKGWTKFKDYEEVWGAFWQAFGDGIGGELDPQIVEGIKKIRVVGLLMDTDVGNEKRVGSTGDSVDEAGKYNLMMLDQLLIHPETKFANIPVIRGSAIQDKGS